MSTFKLRNQLLSNPEGLLIFVHLIVQGRGELAYLVNDVVDHTVTRGTETITYIGLPFRFDPPKDEDGGSTKAALVIANAGRGMSAVVESIQPGDRVYAKVIVTDSAQPDQEEARFRLPMTSVTLGQVECTASIGVEYLMGLSACNKRYTPNLAPSLF